MFRVIDQRVRSTKLKVHSGSDVFWEPRAVSSEAIGCLLLFERVIKHPYLAFIHSAHVSVYMYVYPLCACIYT